MCIYQLNDKLETMAIKTVFGEVRKYEYVWFMLYAWCLEIWLYHRYVVVIFHIEWCNKKTLSSSIMLYNKSSITQHLHANNNPDIFQPYPKLNLLL